MNILQDITRFINEHKHAVFALDFQCQIKTISQFYKHFQLFCLTIRRNFPKFLLIVVVTNKSD